MYRIFTGNGTAKLEATGDKAGRGGSVAMVELEIMAENPTRFAKNSRTNSQQNIAITTKIETFRSQDENDYEYEI